MRFMMLVIPKGYENAKPGTAPDAKAVAAMMKYNESLQKAGVLLALDGLQPPSTGARVTFTDGKPTVSDGPFSGRDLLAGFCIIQVASKQEAIDWVKRWPALDGDGECEIEIRQVFEAEDFGEAFSPEMREAEERMRAEASARQ